MQDPSFDWRNWWPKPLNKGTSVIQLSGKTNKRYKPRIQIEKYTLWEVCVINYARPSAEPRQLYSSLEVSSPTSKMRGTTIATVPPLEWLLLPATKYPVSVRVRHCGTRCPLIFNHSDPRSRSCCCSMSYTRDPRVRKFNRAISFPVSECPGPGDSKARTFKHCLVFSMDYVCVRFGGSPSNIYEGCQFLFSVRD